MTTPAQLLAAAVAAVFDGNENAYHVASDPAIWSKQSGVVQANARDGRTITLVKNHSSSELGITGEPTYTTLIQSPVIYAGRSDVGNGAAEPKFYVEQFKSRFTGIYWEARYGLDKEMKVSTPFLNNGDDRIPDAYSLDLLPLSGTIDNWRTTHTESLLISASANDEYKRRYAFSGNKNRIESQTTAIVSITNLNTHAIDPQLRRINNLAATELASNAMVGISVTTEQRRRQTLLSRQGSNPVADETEEFGLFSIADDLTLTYVGEFNGANWSSADIKTAQLITSKTDGTGRYVLMPSGSHGQFVQHAQQTNQLHIGTLAVVDIATAAISTLYPIYFTSGTDGYDSLTIVSLCYHPTSDKFYALCRTKTHDGTNYIVGFAIYELSITDPVVMFFVCELNSVTYSDNEQRLTECNLKCIVCKPGSSNLYAIGNYAIGSVYAPEAFLFSIDLASGILTEEKYIDNRNITGASIGTFGTALGEMYGVDPDAMQLVRIAHHDGLATLSRSKGVLTIDVIDQSAQNHAVWTAFNVATERAAQTYELMVLTLEGTLDGELVEVEFSSSTDINDQRTPTPAFLHRVPDSQRIRVKLKANEPVDVFVNISNTEFGNFAFRQLRHLAIRIVDASNPFTVRLLRIQMCKLDQTLERPLLPSPETMEKYGVFAPFSASDRRILSWFVQFRAVLVAKKPPVSPKILGWVEQEITPATVINHPFGRLRGGRTFTEYQNDAALNGNTGFGQTPVKLPAVYLQDGFGVDPQVDAPVSAPQVVTVEFDLASSTADNTVVGSHAVNYIVSTSDGQPVETAATFEIDASLVGVVNGLDVSLTIPYPATIASGELDGATGSMSVLMLGTGQSGSIMLTMQNPVQCTIGAQSTHAITVDGTPPP